MVVTIIITVVGCTPGIAANIILPAILAAESRATIVISQVYPLSPFTQIDDIHHRFYLILGPHINFTIDIIHPCGLVFFDAALPWMELIKLIFMLN